MTSEHNSLFGDARNGSHLDARTAFRLTWASLRARYRLRRSAGVVFLAGAVLDPFIYAAIIYLVTLCSATRGTDLIWTRGRRFA